MPLPTLAAQITSTGISAPSYAEILQSLNESFQSIYGSDVYIAADSQDGQLIALIARAINDVNQAAIALYNSYSPTYAQGAGLSSVVKINGIVRNPSSYSTADVTIIGVSGTVITNGVVQDTNSVNWDLPGIITIPSGGEIIVTATAQIAGAVIAAPGNINKILTPTLGWQTVNNVAASVPGSPVESDAALRKRQTVSTALSAQSPFESIIAAVSDLDGITDLSGYENPTGSPDDNGIPAHSISLVVLGGDAIEIATTIANKKTPGTGTYGTTTEIVIDSNGVPNTIHFYRPTVIGITVEITVNKLPGYTTSIGIAIKQAIADYISSLAIGADVFLTRVINAAYNVAGKDTFAVELVEIARDSNPPDPSDIIIAFNELASCSTSDITLTAN